MDSVTYGATGFGAGQAAVRAETARGALNRDTVPDTALRPQIAPFIEEMEVETQITLRYEYGDTDSEDEAARPPPALDPASRPSARPPLKRSAFEIVSDEEESEEEEIPRSSLPNKKPKQTEVVDLTGPLPHVFAAANRTATHRVSYEISSDEEDSVTIKKEPTSKKRVCYEIDSDDEDAIAAVKVENMSTKREKTNSANRTVYNKLYKSYKPFSREGDSHPSGLVESASLGAVSLPSNVKGQELGFDTKTCLYREQADALRAILASTKTFLPNGSNGQEPAARAGFLLGDGTGVGKGRVAAAFIRHLWEEEGVRRFVWLSPINALFEDAKRDLTDVGLFGLLGFRFAHLKDSDCKAKFGARKPDGVLFATYPLFVHDARYKQLLGYLSKGEDGQCAIIFDESHRGKAGVKTETGRKMIKLQSEIPEARVLYMSATPVTEYKQLEYLQRLGLWGTGTPFEDFKSLYTTLKDSAARASLESLCVDLKTMGRYLARSLDLSGTTFELRHVPLTPSFIATYDKAVQLMVSMRQIVLRWIADSPHLDHPLKVAAVLMYFYAFALRLFRSLVVSAKLPGLLDLGKKVLQEDKVLVISLISTGESCTTDGVKNAVDFDDSDFEDEDEEMIAENSLPSAPGKMFRDALCWLLCRIHKHSDPVPEGSNRVLWPPWKPPKRLPTADELDFTSDQVAQQVLAEVNYLLIAAKTSGIDEVPNPLDHLIDQFGGSSKVAELSGRKARMERNSSGNFVLQEKPIDKDEISAFRKGKKEILVFTTAFSTGISLHADPKYPNIKQRVFIPLELPYAVDQLFQQVGRTSRTNQVHAAEIVILGTHLAGETRFLNAVASKATSLGALTRGDRKAPDQILDLSHFDHEQPISQQAMLATLALILEKQQADVELRATPSARFPDGEWKKVYDSVGQIPGCDQEFFTNIHLTFKANGFWNSLFSPTQGMQEDERSSLLSSFKTGTLNRKVGRSLTTFQNRLLMCSLSLQRPLWSLFEAMLKKLTIVMDRKHDRDIRDYGLSQEQGVVIESTTNVGWSSITSASCKVSRIQVWTKGKRKPEKYSIVWGHLLPLWKILIDIVTDLASYDEKRKIKTIRANVVRIHADDPTVPPSFIGVVIPNSYDYVVNRLRRELTRLRAEAQGRYAQEPVEISDFEDEELVREAARSLIELDD